MQNDLDVQFLHMDTNSLDSMELKFAVQGKEYKAKLPVPGAHNVMNALAAVALGVALGVDIQEAVERLENFRPMSMRFERVQLANGVRVVNDSYNANPESMRAAFRTVGSAKRAGRFVAALGDMLELGESSAELHRQVGMVAAQMGVESLYLVGDFAEDIAEGARKEGLDSSQIFVCTEGAENIGRILENELHAGDVLLVKGSRGMKMEKVVEYLKSSIGMG
jgi:UDP-N-acetylmuramoyl-tripeptide--D-alanyl-D-alanine ligase